MPYCILARFFAPLRSDLGDSPAPARHIPRIGLRERITRMRAAKRKELRVMPPTSLSKDLVRIALAGIPNPSPVADSGSDLVSSGAFQWASACDTYASIKLHVPGVPPHVLDSIARTAHGAIVAEAATVDARVDSLIVEFVNEPGDVVHTAKFGAFTGGTGRPAPAPAAQAAAPASAGGHQPIGGLADTKRGAAPTPQQGLHQGTGPLPGVKHIIAVGAGKGGVGKSSIALNLAIGLARKGHAVGLLDGDIYGPSMPTMLGLGTLDQSVLNGKLQPFLVHGIKSITIGKLVDADKPLIWRGPMAHGAFKQLVEQTTWGELDYLIIDLPPGTGDISLTMSQTLKLSGAVVVCTPQQVAQDDAIRALRMFQQLGVDILGVVENMSSFVGDDGKEYDIFGKGGAQTMAQRCNVPFLGAVPITMSLRANSDSGEPVKNYTDTDPAGVRLTKSLETVVNNFESQIALADMKQAAQRPVLTIS